MTREIDRNASIRTLFESAGRSIPDLDGHNIRVAERRILWSKIAQQVSPTAPAGVPAAVAPAPLPPSATPEQVAQWNKPRTYEEWEEQIKHPQQMSDQQVMDQSAWQASNSEDALAQLLRARGPAAPTARPTGAAHVQQPAAPARRPAAKPAPTIQLPNMTIEGEPPENVVELPNMNIVGDPNEMAYTPGPGDPNYTGASKSVLGLLKIADYLSKKKS